MWFDLTSWASVSLPVWWEELSDETAWVTRAWHTACPTSVHSCTFSPALGKPHGVSAAITDRPGLEVLRGTIHGGYPWFSPPSSRHVGEPMRKKSPVTGKSRTGLLLEYPCALWLAFNRFSESFEDNNMYPHPFNWRSWSDTLMSVMTLKAFTSSQDLLLSLNKKNKPEV